MVGGGRPSEDLIRPGWAKPEGAFENTASVCIDLEDCSSLADFLAVISVS